MATLEKEKEEITNHFSDVTYVEFFDRVDVENICTCLINPPKRVIMLGDKQKLLAKHSSRYKDILKRRGYDIEFVCRSINRNNLQDMVAALSEIVTDYDNCYFDLTGGGELYLVAMGIIYERYKHKNIQMHRFNILNNTICDCDQDGITIAEEQLPNLSVMENIYIYGGDIVYDDVKANGTYDWDLNTDFKNDIDKIWDICKKDVRLWNTQIGILEVAEDHRKKSDDPLNTKVSLKTLTNSLKAHGNHFVFIKHIFNKMYQDGLITSYKYDPNQDLFTITYKNEQVKRCLTKAGLSLEMKIYKTLKEVKDDEGNFVYNDVMNGVVIDWDGEIHTEEGENDTENEIDVLAMKGSIPIFISCKNGIVGNEELYKLTAVADKFGDKYARKVLIVTSLSPNSRASNDFRQRAKDMNIKLIEGIQTMSTQEFNKTMRNIWVAL